MNEDFYNNLAEFREKRYTFFLIFISIFLSYYCFTLFIPNLFKTIDDFELHESKIESVKIDNRSLIIVLIDGTEWTLSEKHSRYWPIISDNGNLGKSIKLWFDDTKKSSEPIQIMLNDKIIYLFKKDNKTDVLFIFLTLALLILTILKVKTLLNKI